MSTAVEDQLEVYFGWVEAHCGVALSPILPTEDPVEETVGPAPSGLVSGHVRTRRRVRRSSVAVVLGVVLLSGVAAATGLLPPQVRSWFENASGPGCLGATVDAQGATLAASVETRQGAEIELWNTSSSGGGLASVVTYVLPDGTREGAAVTCGAAQAVVGGSPNSTWMSDIRGSRDAFSVWTVDDPALDHRFFIGHVPEEATTITMSLSDGRVVTAEVQRGGYYIVPLDGAGDVGTPPDDRPNPSDGRATRGDGLVVATFGDRR